VRILHVVPTYLPATRYGGPIHAVHGLCRALADRGHQVEVVTTNVDGDRDSNVRCETPVSLDGVEVRYFRAASRVVPRRIARRLYVAPELKRDLERRIRTFEIVHLHSVFLWPTFAAARIASRNRVPYVLTPRGMLVPELIRERSRLAKELWLRAVEAGTLRNSAGVHFTSKREWDDAARTGLPLPEPFVVPNGVEPAPESARTRSENTLLYLGRISWKKGLDRLIDALALVPDVMLTIAGNDEENLTPALEARALRQGVRSRITFLGEVRGDSKAELLESSAALVLPSLSENFGNVVLEAMAAATPVIVTPEVGLADDVRAAGAGLVASGDASALAAAIGQLVSDPPLQREMGARGRRLVAERFTWPVVAERMEREYARILRPGR
jgi:glycosyltransferase involved in cell wall biosynthesis